MSINYDFGDLEAFLAVKETGSFHAAGARLNLSQSAITRRIRKLEQALGSPLFERTTRTVKPTLAAKRLQPRAEAMVNDARETSRAMQDASVSFAHQREAIVTIATVPTVTTRFITPAIRFVQASGGNLRVRLLDGSANEVAEAVVQGDADFGLCSIPMLEPTTEFEPLLDDAIVLAVHLESALDGTRDLPLSALVDMPLILPARGTGNRLLIDESLARERLSIAWSFEAGRSTTALDLVTSGMGAALLPMSAIDPARVGYCILQEPGIVRTVGLLSRAGQADTPMVLKLKQAIRAQV
ncbi:LysR family transcriptional regulator [Shimia abyssi]|uniref:DNA-binding transcriptional LysR family regulator n=1 Tax=Shimia abyssi TaxID=1662395 RepID=A0A2P8F6X5_9RHOB|nr:LysR family transcriptional regulator [Shimia abyssi]PSL17467.1 DNA-binding transcriptional LysR family regulator [Shimia abyssi]